MLPALTLVNWEDRPAVLTPAGAYAIVSPDGSWKLVSRAEVVDSGKPLSEKTWSAMFPFADISTIPKISSSNSK